MCAVFGLIAFSEPVLVQAEDLTSIRNAVNNRACIVLHEGNQEPAVAFTASAFDVPGFDKKEVMALLDGFLVNGCSIHDQDAQGMSPVNVAILIGEPDLLAYILKKGGEPSLRITNSRSWVNGRNSYEFARLLYKVKAGDNRKKIIDILEAEK